MTEILSCSFPVEQQPKYPGPKAEKNANDYFPYYMGKYKENKRWTSPLCWRSGEDPRKQTVSESEWFSQQRKQQIPHRGKKKQKLSHFLINQVIQLTTSDVVTHSLLLVLLPTLPPHKIAADPVYSWWDYWRVNSCTNYETRSQALLLSDFYADIRDPGKFFWFLITL